MVSHYPNPFMQTGLNGAIINIHWARIGDEFVGKCQKWLFPNNPPKKREILVCYLNEGNHLSNSIVYFCDLWLWNHIFQSKYFWLFLWEKYIG